MCVDNLSPSPLVAFIAVALSSTPSSQFLLCLVMSPANNLRGGGWLGGILMPCFPIDKELANTGAGNNLVRRLHAGFIFQPNPTLMHIRLEKCGFMQTYEIWFIDFLPRFAQAHDIELVLHEQKSKIIGSPKAPIQCAEIKPWSTYNLPTLSYIAVPVLCYWQPAVLHVSDVPIVSIAGRQRRKLTSAKGPARSKEKKKKHTKSLSLVSFFSLALHRQLKVSD